MNAKLVSKLRKLLRLAEQDNAEGTTARAKAEELAKRHGLTLTALGEDADPNAVVDQEGLLDLGSAVWAYLLATDIESYCHVTAYRQTKLVRDAAGKPVRGPNGKFVRKSTLGVIGTPQDTETFLALFKRAHRDIDAEAVRYAAGCPAGTRRSAADSFRKGAATGFGERLKAYAAEAQAHSVAEPGMGADGRFGIVLISRALAVKRVAKASGIKAGRGASLGDGGAYARGQSFGRNMGVHRGNLS